MKNDEIEKLILKEYGFNEEHSGDCINECHTCLKCLAENVAEKLKNKFHVIPKSDPPEKWVKAMIGEQEQHEVFHEAVELKWRENK